VSDIIQKAFRLLGLRVEDKVTGFKGVLTSVSFDLYGCTQVIINPGINESGKLGASAWFDVNRIRVLATTPVMEVPQSFRPDVGPENKPILNKS
jgi:hypothetical protein